MSGWAKFIQGLQSRGPTPGAFSLYHILSLVVVIGLCVVVCLFNKKFTTKKTYKYIILGVWVLLIIFEILKQLLFMFDIKDGKAVLNYQWYIFPFQFCSSPHYLLPFIVFLPECKIKKRFELFSTLFILFGGIMGIAIPQFTIYYLINFQTVLHHGLMVVVAIYIAINNKEEFKHFKNFLETTPIFLSFVVIALLLNWIIPELVPGIVVGGADFNMFFISWRIPTTVPILSSICKAVPYPVYLLIYIVGFIALTFGIYCIYSLIFYRKVCLNMQELKRNYKAKKPTKKSSK